jgi:hypothetical protein
LLTYFSTFGAFVAFGIVREGLVISMFGYRANRAWLALEAFIERERLLRGDPEYAIMFEHLVCRTRDNWPLSKSYGIKLQTRSRTLGDPNLGTGGDPSEILRERELGGERAARAQQEAP